MAVKWTESYLRKVMDENPAIKICPGYEDILSKRSEKKKKKKDKNGFTSAENQKIAGALNVLGIKTQIEYRFDKVRRFRFDVAVPDHMIAIEYEGGTYSGGRHTNGKGYAKDCEKYNLAQKLGWNVQRYTCDIKNKENWEYLIAYEIKQIIEEKKNDRI